MAANATRGNSCGTNYYVCALACADSDSAGDIAIPCLVLPSPSFLPAAFLLHVLIIIRGATPTSTIAQRLLLADSRQGGREILPIVSSFHAFHPVRPQKRGYDSAVVNLAASGAALMSRSRLTSAPSWLRDISRATWPADYTYVYPGFRRLDQAVAFGDSGVRLKRGSRVTPRVLRMVHIWGCWSP